MAAVLAGGAVSTRSPVRSLGVGKDVGVLAFVTMFADALDEEAAVRNVRITALITSGAAAGFGELEAEPLVPRRGWLGPASVATGWSSGGRVACAT